MDWRDLIDGFGQIVIILSPDHFILEVNKACLAVLGLTRDEIVGRKCFHVFHGPDKDGPPPSCPLEAGLASGKLESSEMEVEALGGFYLVSCNPVLDSEGGPEYFIHVATDISERLKSRFKLAESEARFRSLFRDNSVAMLLIEPDSGRILDANNAAADFYGWSRDKLRSMRIHDINILSREEINAEMAAARSLNKRHFDFKHRLADGRIRDVEVYSGPIIIEGKETLYSSVIDVTERNQAQDMLAKSEERLKLALEAVNDGVWDWNLETGETFFNPRWYSMLGYEPDEFPQTFATWRGLVHPEDLPRADELIKAHLLKSASYEVELRMRAKDGEWKWIFSRGKAVSFTPSGEVNRMVGTHMDVTERKKSERELSDLRNYLSNIIDSMPSILIGVDAGVRVTQWNKTAEAASGVLARDAVGRPLQEVYPFSAAEMELVRQAVKTGEHVLDARRTRQEDDQTRHEEMTIYPLAGGEAKGAVIRIDDVTERVRLEEMIVQSEKMMSVGGLAAGMAHEINNPLAGILGHAHNIKNRVFGDAKRNQETAKKCGVALEAVREYLRLREIPGMLDGIHDLGIRAAKIVNNMLSFSRKSSKEYAAHDLAGLLDKTLELAASDYDLIKEYDFRSIEIVREYDPAAPKVYCQASELQQVFLNLFKNGAEAMAGKDYKGERPRFSLRLRREGEMVAVEVEDNGPGLEEPVRKRIFEPFFTTKQVGQGTGLGLSVSYFIITEQHKGVMEAYSLPGAWTRIVIKLPVRPQGFDPSAVKQE